MLYLGWHDEWGGGGEGPHVARVVGACGPSSLGHVARGVGGMWPSQVMLSWPGKCGHCDHD